MEPDGQAEPVSQGQLVIHGIARIDRIILLGRVPGDDRAAVCRHRQAHVGRAGIDPALQPGTQVARAFAIAIGKAQVIDEDQEPALLGA